MLRRALLPTLLIGLLATALVGCGDDETTSVTFECSGGGGGGPEV